MLSIIRVSRDLLVFESTSCGTEAEAELVSEIRRICEEVVQLHEAQGTVELRVFERTQRASIFRV